jgi:hypothetical protein
MYAEASARYIMHVAPVDAVNIMLAVIYTHDCAEKSQTPRKEALSVRCSNVRHSLMQARAAEDSERWASTAGKGATHAV